MSKPNAEEVVMSLRDIAELTRILAEQDGKNPQGLPPVHLWEPPFCGDIDIRVHRDGRWSYLGSVIERPALVRLLASVLRRDEDGDYYLVTPVEKMRIQVEDAPLQVIRAESSRDSAQQPLWLLYTLTGDCIELGPQHALWVEEKAGSGEPMPYVHVRARLHARLMRNPFYQLVDAAEPGERVGERCHYGVWSAGHFFSLGLVDGDELLP